MIQSAWDGISESSDFQISTFTFLTCEKSDTSNQEPCIMFFYVWTNHIHTIFWWVDHICWQIFFHLPQFFHWQNFVWQQEFWGYCTLWNETIETNWKICILRNEKSVLCKVKILWKTCFNIYTASFIGENYWHKCFLLSRVPNGV